MILSAHRISLELLPRWSGRLFRRPAGGATLHAADFQLALDDGEFGDASAARMPDRASFLALTEYLPGAGLVAGSGLFAARGIKLPLEPTAFGPSRLAHPRRGQAGTQQFFSAAGRPFCLYIVVAGAAQDRRRQLAVLDRTLATLRIEAAASGPPR